MPPTLFGTEHILYIVISAILGGASLLLAKIFARTEKAKNIFLKVLAVFLFIAIATNRLSQVFRYETVQWFRIIPDSYCGMTSFCLSLAVLLGKRNNPALHFLWPLGLFGGISTVAYATFVGQGATLFYLPTISGLVHHSLSAMLVIALLLFKQIDITYKKWHYTLFGFTAYLTVGTFLMHFFPISDAFHIAEPLLPGTPLTTWVMAPIYAVAYAIVLLIAAQVKKKRRPTERD